MEVAVGEFQFGVVVLWKTCDRDSVIELQCLFEGVVLCVRVLQCV